MTAQARTQLYRFVRIFAVTLAGAIVALGADNLNRAAVLAALVGAVEAAWRQLFPAVPDGTTET